MDDSQQKVTEATQLALGRFVVSYSALFYALEHSTIELLTMTADGPNGASRFLIQTALADRTAAPITSSFFSVFHLKWSGQLTPADQKILKALNKEIQALIKTRNRLMHDAWLVPTLGGSQIPQEFCLTRLKTHGSGAEYERTEYSAHHIDALAADAIRLSHVVWATTFYARDCQSGPELHPRITIVNEKVVRS